MSALILTNTSHDAKGQLPPSTCKQDSSTMVTCTAPAPGISEVVFQTYPNLKALYAAYTAKVMSLQLQSVQAELQRLRIEATVRRGRLEPPVPAHRRRTPSTR